MDVHLTPGLVRHEKQREAGVPVLTVLAGPLCLARQAVERWASEQGRSVVALDEPLLERLLGSWVRRVAAERDLARDAAAWLARTLGQAEALLLSEVARKTRFERITFLEVALPEETGSPAEQACRWLIERGLDTEPAPVDELVGAISGGHGTAHPEAVASAFLDLIPRATSPVLLVSPPGTMFDITGWADLSMQSLARLVAVAPRLTCIVALEHRQLEAYFTQAPESRAKAIARAGLIQVGLDELLAPNPPGKLTVADDDLARSAAERFLFDQLEALPETAGLFELNGMLDLPFGPFSQMEVDLLARGPGIAVEVDGYYHFQDVEAYRRDRRKDLALQTGGYLVLRVLADDVVSRLETILGSIKEAVVSRRSRIRK